MQRPTSLLRPDRVRTIQKERPFAWLPCRLLTGGILQSMAPEAKLLYLHLVLAADRWGISFWGNKRIAQICTLSPRELQQAQQQLLDLDLLAYDGRTFQLLSLPQPTSVPLSLPVAPTIAARRPTDSPAEIPERARVILRRLLGHDFPG